MMTVRMPRLLNPDGAEALRLNPSALSVAESLWTLSTANMTLPDGEPTLRVRDLVELFGTSGSFGFFRVSSTTTLPGESQLVDLEHTFAVLDDDVTEADKTLSGTMRDILTAILGYQYLQRWQLGDVECTTSGLELKVDRITLRDALVAAVKLVDDYGIFFEQTDKIWKIHVRKLATTPTCECRLSRNAANVELEIDDHDLCTRVVADELPGGSLQVEETEWGMVTHALSIPAGASDAQALKYAQAYLREHQDPSVSIRIDAVELAALTGEKWDSFTLGGMCRAALPDWGLTQDKRITTMDHVDLLGAPTKVRLELAKPERRIEEISASNRRGSGGANRKATEAEKGLILYDARIGLITDDLVSAMVRLDAAEASILLKVEKDGIISAINVSPEAITIEASKVNLKGYVTASQLQAEIASINTAISTKIVTSSLSSATVECTKLFVDDAEMKPRTIRYTDADGNAASMVVLVA